MRQNNPPKLYNVSIDYIAGITNEYKRLKKQAERSLRLVFMLKFQ